MRNLIRQKEAEIARCDAQLAEHDAKLAPTSFTGVPDMNIINSVGVTPTLVHKIDND